MVQYLFIILNKSTYNSKKLPPLPESNIEKNNIFERKPFAQSNQNQNAHDQQISQQKNTIQNQKVNNDNLSPPKNQKMSAKDKNKKEKIQGIKKNITNNRISIPQDISQEDRVGEDFNADNNNSEALDNLQKEQALKGSSYKEDLKTGKFIQISKKNMDKIMDESTDGMKEHDGYIDEDSKWYKLIDDFNSIIFRFVFLLQGLLSGLLIMIAVTSIEQNWQNEGYRYRLNQIIWIIALICFFGQLYIYQVYAQKCQYSFTNGSPQLSEHRSLKTRALINMIFYGIIYYCIMISHYYVSMLSYTGTGEDAIQVGESEKNGYSYLILISAIFSFIGWIIVGNQTKSNYVEMEYDDDDLTRPGDDSDEEF